jgi:peptide chain release factor 3
MDPKHRDRIAFIRICAGRYTPGMAVRNVRSGRELRLAAPQQFLAQERQRVDEAVVGDVVGVHDRGSLRIGDALSSNGDFDFGGMPRFSPEHFARILVPDPLRRKHLDTGLRQLSEEGAAQVFYEDTAAGHTPIVGAVGLLQFDVLLHRLEHEYGVKARLERLPFSHARWVAGDPKDIQRIAKGYGRALVHDSKEQPLILFDTSWTMQTTLDKEKDVAFHDVQR